jgi:flagellar motility protein MotE (MotC chaperone)
LPIAYNLSFAEEQKQEQPQNQPQKQESIEEERLSIIKSDIQKEIEHNEKLKKEIEEAQKNIDENTKERLMKVSKMYEAMPAEEAAKRLEKLDENTAVDILIMLKPRAAGGILAQMDSDKAASISKKIITKGKR